MIKLEVEEYCDDCPEFDAHIEKAVLFDGCSKEYCNTNITCEHKDKCNDACICENYCAVVLVERV